MILAAAIEQQEFSRTQDQPPTRRDLAMDIILTTEIIGDATDVEIVKWLVASGTTVRAGTSLAELETGKATFELSAPSGGVLQIVAAAGSVVEPGAKIGTIE